VAERNSRGSGAVFFYFPLIPVMNNAVQTIPPDLSEARTSSFFRAIRDEDNFTILYELAYSKQPVSIEMLRKTFGADLKYVAVILAQLERLGVVAQRGRAWVISEWAKLTLKFLEERLENLQVELAETTSASLDVSDSRPQDIVSAVGGVGTNNGFWVATASRITVLDRKTALSSQTATHTDGIASLAPERSDRGHNETRSHLYK
jgi:hypothetical protein